MERSRGSMVAAATAFVAIGAAMFFTISVYRADVATAKQDLPAGQDRVMIPVEGMTCGACAASIHRSVLRLDGIVDVEVDHLKGAVTVVRITGKVTVDQIIEAINRTGFRATHPKQT